MSIKYRAASSVSKILAKTCRLAKSGGTTLPGKVAIKIYPCALEEASKNYKTIMVTGTNGKTTTARMIEQILKENGIEYITNKSGANLISGITTTFLNSTGLTEKSSNRIALIEVDEAAFSTVCDFVKPDILVVTNFFRDQLDRYGELYTTVKSVNEGIEKLKNCRLVLNADDSLCASLGVNTDKLVVHYGIESGAYKESKQLLNSDAIHCLFCKSKYVFSYHTYGHLGGYRCPGCGYKRPFPNTACTGVSEMNSSYSKIRISTGYSGKNLCFHTKINLPGFYNIYNALAAITCCELLHLPAESWVKGLGNCECGFGRMEAVKVDGKAIKLILAKNPSSFNQAIDFLELDEKQMLTAFIINDKLADGTDISWLWDVDFEKLQALSKRITRFYISGTRAEDMALRLKYAGINTAKIQIIKDYGKMINEGLSHTPKGSIFYLFPTYTAMFEIRKYLTDLFGLREFWK